MKRTSAAAFEFPSGFKSRNAGRNLTGYGLTALETRQEQNLKVD
ncbi:MAG: hypothetical protein V2A61_03545 [Calditrichota bacterium]